MMNMQHVLVGLTLTGGVGTTAIYQRKVCTEVVIPMNIKDALHYGGVPRKQWNDLTGKVGSILQKMGESGENYTLMNYQECRCNLCGLT